MRNVIVTGGSRGLGLGIARGLAGAGYRVIAVARRPSDELGAAMAECGDTLKFWPFDLADVAGIAKLPRAIRKQFGPLYGLVNNAGIGTSGVLANMRVADIERTVQLNTVSPMVLTKHVVRAMMVDGGKGADGRIVNISSIVSVTGFSELAICNGAKASLHRLHQVASPRGRAARHHSSMRSRRALSIPR